MTVKVERRQQGKEGRRGGDEEGEVEVGGRVPEQTSGDNETED